MAWFHPKTLLDKSYEIGLFVKALDGAFEFIGGLFLLVVPGDAIARFTVNITQNELAKDPSDFVATHILHYGQSLAHGHNGFAIAFLLTHGIVKIALVVALLRNKLWAYPWALVILTLFLVYQVYTFVLNPGFGLGFLSLVDVAIILLVWREWRVVKPDAHVTKIAS